MYGKNCASTVYPCTMVAIAMIFLIVTTVIDSDSNVYNNGSIGIETTELESKLIEYYDCITCCMIVTAITWLIYVIIYNIMIEFNVGFENTMFYVRVYCLCCRLSLLYDYVVNARLFAVLNPCLGSYFVCKLYFYCLFVCLLSYSLLF